MVDKWDVPLADWLIISDEAKAPRCGGVGKVPTDAAGTEEDLRVLEKEAWTAYALGRVRRLEMRIDPRVAAQYEQITAKFPPNQTNWARELPSGVAPRVFTVQSLSGSLPSFSLAPETAEPLPLRSLLLPEHLEPEYTASRLPLETQSRSQSRTPQAWTAKPATCARIGRQQKERQIRLRLSNMRTLLPDRWLDSVVIDAYLHILQEHWPQKDKLYVHSAEANPTLKEIVQTPGCYKFILIPLWRLSHWTVLLVDHTPFRVPTSYDSSGKPLAYQKYKGRIRYINSQVVNPATPDIQTRPFEEAFPDYYVANNVRGTAQQCDNSSCGVYVCFWAFCLLYYSEKEILEVRCADIDKFRRRMIHQLFLYYFFSHRFGVKEFPFFPS